MAAAYSAAPAERKRDAVDSSFSARLSRGRTHDHIVSNGVLLKDRQRKPSNGGSIPFARLRLSSIESLIRGRHRIGHCDTSDNGEDYMRAALPCLRALGRGKTGIVLAWAKRWVPVYVDEMGDDWFADLEESFTPPQSADEAAAIMTVRHAEVEEYGLRTIGAVDRPKSQRLADRRTRDREYQRRRREENGATPRSMAQASFRPWEAEGISESTWRRRRRADRVSSSA